MCRRRYGGDLYSNSMLFAGVNAGVVDIQHHHHLLSRQTTFYFMLQKNGCTNSIRMSCFVSTQTLSLLNRYLLCCICDDDDVIQEKMIRCPRQTDALIQCMKKNPLFFHSS